MAQLTLQEIQDQYYRALGQNDLATAARLRGIVTKAGTGFAAPTDAQQAVLDSARAAASGGYYQNMLQDDPQAAAAGKAALQGAGLTLADPTADQSEALLEQGRQKRRTAVQRMTNAMPASQQALANAGAVLQRAGIGVKQALYDPIADRLAPVPAGQPTRAQQDAQAVQDINETSAPLDNTWGGRFGAVIGNVGAALPLLPVPAAAEARVAAAGLTGGRALLARAGLMGAAGAAEGAVAPVSGGGQRLTNTLLGAAAGPVGEGISAGAAKAGRGLAQLGRGVAGYATESGRQAAATQGAGNALARALAPTGEFDPAAARALADTIRAGDVADPLLPNVGLTVPEILQTPQGANLTRMLRNKPGEANAVMSDAHNQRNEAVQAILAQRAGATVRPMANPAAGDGIDSVLDRSAYFAGKAPRDADYQAFKDANIALPNQNQQYSDIADALDQGFFGARGPGLAPTGGTGASAQLAFTPEETDLARSMVQIAKDAGNDAKAMRPQKAYGLLAGGMQQLVEAHPQLAGAQRGLLGQMNVGLVDAQPYLSKAANAALTQGASPAANTLSGFNSLLARDMFPSLQEGAAGKVPAATIFNALKNAQATSDAVNLAAGMPTARLARGAAADLSRASGPLRQQLDVDRPGYLAAQQQYAAASGVPNAQEVWQEALRDGLMKGTDTEGNLALTLPKVEALVKNLRAGANIDPTSEATGDALLRLAQRQNAANISTGAAGSGTFHNSQLSEEAARQAPNLARYASWRPLLAGGGLVGSAFGGAALGGPLGAIVAPVGAVGASLLTSNAVKRRAAADAAALARLTVDPQRAAQALDAADWAARMQRAQLQEARRAARIRGGAAGLLGANAFNQQGD